LLRSITFGLHFNGFYLVQVKNAIHKSKGIDDGDEGLETKTIYCAFRQPGGISSAILEKRVITSSLNVDAAAVSLGWSSTGGIHFNVKTNSELETSSILTKIQFNANLLNMGGGFNGFTRVFIAPKTGIY